MEHKQFGRYVIVAELGRGSMGAVHRAVDPLIERDAAIKTLLPNLPPEVMAEMRERFVREGRSAGRLNHPNIVTIYDVGEQDGIAYIAMEFLQGRTLQQMLREPGRLPLETIVDIAAQVADALDHAQRFGIVHRDVKPANIMVSAQGRVKLTDFGVAHVPASVVTQIGSTIGSPKYMSPEQVTSQPIDPRADIFSLGVVLYEMLAGRTPFAKPGDKTVDGLMTRIVKEPHLAITAIDPAIPRAFDLILDCALAKSPANRYPLAGDMASDLRNYRNLARVGGARPPAETAFEKTTVLAPPAGDPQAKPPATGQTDSGLIADVEVFSRSFEHIQKERLRAEEEERRRKEEELRRWAQTEELRREQFERARDTSPAARPVSGRRKSALELLKEKAASRAAAETPASKTALAAHIDARLRAAFHYLSEFATTLNAAHPVSERKQGMMFFGEVAGLVLSDSFTDCRTREVHGTHRIDFVNFRYKVSFPKPATLEVPAQQLARVRERLDAMRIVYEYAEKKNDFGQAKQASFRLTGPFPCQTLLRGDYVEPGFVLETINVRRIGEIKTRLGPDQLTDELLDEFGAWVLGEDDAFERFLKPR